MEPVSFLPFVFFGSFQMQDAWPLRTLPFFETLSVFPLSLAAHVTAVFTAVFVSLTFTSIETVNVWPL